MTERETIAAISTAPGRAAISLIRISGQAAAEIAIRLGLGRLKPRRATYGRLRHPEDGRTLDTVMATYLEGPGSYTGEDMLEIGCHGGFITPQLILDACISAGARSAHEGEFTRRAFLNGKLDLLQVEAVGDLIDARSEALHRGAIFQLERGLSERIESLRTSLLELRALMAYEIDFPDEDDGPVAPARIDADGREIQAQLNELLRFAPEGELLREGALTVIAGHPNQGKSSVFNALLGEQRAIVTEQPGTTRDAIEALLSVEGYPFRLVDTAGLRERAERVERLGIEVAQRYLECADLVLFCAEASREMDPEERAFLQSLEHGADGSDGAEVMILRTKSDLAPARRLQKREVCVSARTGEGFERLRAQLVAHAFAGLSTSGEAPLVTRRRQVRGLKRAARDMTDFLEARAAGLPAEMAVTHLEEAAAALGELLGVATTEDILDVLFRGFCVGK